VTDFHVYEDPQLAYDGPAPRPTGDEAPTWVITDIAHADPIPVGTVRAKMERSFVFSVDPSGTYHFVGQSAPLNFDNGRVVPGAVAGR